MYMYSCNPLLAHDPGAKRPSKRPSAVAWFQGAAMLRRVSPPAHEEGRGATCTSPLQVHVIPPGQRHQTRNQASEFSVTL